MHIQVQDGDPARGAQMLGRDGGVVQVAEAVGAVDIGVVAGRTAQRVGRALAVQHQLGRVGGAMRRPGRRFPGARADRTRGIAHVIAGQADDVFGIGAGLAGKRVHIGHHFLGCVGQFAPARVSGFQESQVLRRVHRARGGAAPWSARRSVPVAPHRRQQARAALGLLVAAPDLAAHDEELRIMKLVLIAVDDFHVFLLPLVSPAAPCCETNRLRTCSQASSRCTFMQAARGCIAARQRVQDGLVAATISGSW